MHFCLLLWPFGLKKSFYKKGTTRDLFLPRPVSAHGLIWPKTTLIRDNEYFILTKFHKIPSSGSEDEVEIVNVYTRTTKGALITAHLSRTAALLLKHSCPSQQQSPKMDIS